MAIRIILWLYFCPFIIVAMLWTTPREQKNNIKTASFGPSVDDKMT